MLAVVPFCCFTLAWLLIMVRTVEASLISHSSLRFVYKKEQFLSQNIPRNKHPKSLCPFPLLVVWVRLFNVESRHGHIQLSQSCSISTAFWMCYRLWMSSNYVYKWYQVQLPGTANDESCLPDMTADIIHQINRFVFDDWEMLVYFGKQLSWIHNPEQSGFSSLSHMRISIFEIMSVYLIDRYQNAIPRAMPFHEFTLVTHDSIGHLKTLCMRVLSVSGGVESEWKHCSSLLSGKINASILVWIQLQPLMQ